MAIFLKYGAIAGEVIAAPFKEWIEVSSFQWGVGRGISSGVGGASKREASAPSVSEITITKTFDASSPLLLKESLGGKAVEVKVSLTQTDNKASHIAYQEYVLTNCLISGYSISSGGDRPSESLSLNFTKAESTYWKVNDKFEATKAGTTIFDIAKSELS
jgi:type VI secretion system secreted protein Hcp